MLVGVMQALELMKTHVVKTTPDATLGEAVDLMDLYQVNGLPVVDAEGVLCGMLTEHDVLRAMMQQDTSDASGSSALGIIRAEGTGHPALASHPASDKPVREFMSTPAQSVLEHEDALAAAGQLLTANRKALPVVDQNRRVIGMLYRIDIFQAIFERLLP